MDIREQVKEVIINKGGIAKSADFVAAGIRAADVVNLCNAGFLNRVRHGYYELAEKIVKLLEDKVKCQTILTSHNTALMTNKIMRPDCYFILTRDRLVSLSNATQRELREGHNLERLYMGGEFDE